MSLLDTVNRVEAKLDKQGEKLDAVVTQTAVNTANLAEHMRRTAILEDRLSPGKIVTIIAGITAIVYTLVKLVQAL